MKGRRLYRKIQEILYDYYKINDDDELVMETAMAGPVQDIDNNMSWFEQHEKEGVIWTHKYNFFHPVQYIPEECKLDTNIWILMKWFNHSIENKVIRDYFFYAHCPKHRYLLSKILEKYYKRNLWHY